jgi:hypothetical protein
MPIGTLNEQPLHAALKAWYAEDGDQVEVTLDGYVIDLVRGDLLIEIQTANFSAIRRKLAALTKRHPVRLVYPIPRDKWIVRLDDQGDPVSRRKSPRRGVVVHLFAELVRIPALLAHPRFSLDVLLIQEEEQRRYDGQRGWRRHGWVVHQRLLLDVLDQQRFESPGDALALIPPALPDPFTTADLAEALGCSRRLAQQMCYCLRAMDTVETVGKRSNALLYARRSE